MSAIRIAVQDVQHAANTDAAAQKHLDSSLVQLIRSIDGMDSNTSELSRLDALEMLAGVVQGAAMAGLGPSQEESLEDEDTSIECNDVTTIELSSSLQSIAQLVEVNPRQPTAAGTAQEVQVAVEKLVLCLPPTFFQAIIPPGALTDAQIAILTEVDTALQAENALRRRMLIERAKVTLQSFLWSRRLSDDVLKKEAETVMEAGLAVMEPTPHVALQDVFSATLGDVMTVTERATSTSSNSDAMRAKVKDVIIGNVPDRGGRTDGRRKVAMPEWSERKVTAGGRGGGGRGRGGGRGKGGGRGVKK